MSDFVGRWKFDGPQDGNDFIERTGGLLSPNNPDGTASYCDKSIAVLYAAFYTDCESRTEPQPFRSRRGLIFTWDGRLDNRDDFNDQADPSSRELPDVAIVAAAYERWGNSLFARLTGDWVISIWNPPERTLALAKDEIGVRHLYWHITPHHALWGTSLDAIKRIDACSHSLDEHYIAG
jgi:asparagine synthase (glutamine-hydrolysing)